VIPLVQLTAATRPADSTVGPGVGGFLVIFALAVATVLLIRSMVGHLRKVRYGPGPPDGAARPHPPDQPAPPGDPAPPDEQGSRPPTDTP
jgi:hypothetical protein